MQAQTFTHAIPGNKQLLFMPAIFNDTLKLLLEAQEYFTHFAPADQSELPSSMRLVYSSEMSRITLRLSSIMAWLLARRASSAGFATEESKLHEYQLQFQDVCLQELPANADDLPFYMRSLLDRTRALYERATRISSPIN